MHRIVVSTLLILVCWAGPTGCQNTGGGSRILDARAQRYVEDIPVPKGFVLLERKSTHRSAAGRREVRHLYEGRADTIAVKSFYARQMPSAGWELLDDTLKEFGVHLINYKKGRERCEIRIERAPAAFFGEVTHVFASVTSEGV